RISERAPAGCVGRVLIPGSAWWSEDRARLSHTLDRDQKQRAITGLWLPVPILLCYQQELSVRRPGRPATCGQTRQLPFWSTDLRDEVNAALAARAGERNMPPVRRPSRVSVEGWITGKTQHRRLPYHLHVYIRVVLLFAVPGECQLLAVG